MENTQLYNRIKQRLDEIGLTERQASMLAVGNSQFIRNIRTGKSASPRGENILKLARTLEVSESWLLGSTDDMGATGTINATLSQLKAGPTPPLGHQPGHPPIPARKPFGVKFGGIVDAGSWRVVDTMNQDGEFKRVPVAPDPRYPFEMQFAFLVAGDSMNKARIFEGMHVLAVEISEWERRHRETTDGQIVVVEALRNGGHERERTIKRLRVFRDRVELQPESDNPQHETIILLNGDDEKGRVVAVALTASWVLG